VKLLARVLRRTVSQETATARREKTATSPPVRRGVSAWAPVGPVELCVACFGRLRAPGSIDRGWAPLATSLSFFSGSFFFQKAVAENGAPTNKSSPSARDSTETIFKQADVWPPDPAEAQRRQCRNHVIKSVMTLIGSLIRLLVVYWCARAAWEQPGSRHTTPRHPWNGTEWRWVFGPLSHKTYNPSLWKKSK
jgi:hypothetical protein